MNHNNNNNNNNNNSASQSNGSFIYLESCPPNSIVDSGYYSTDSGLSSSNKLFQNSSTALRSPIGNGGGSGGGGAALSSPHRLTPLGSTGSSMVPSPNSSSSTSGSNLLPPVSTFLFASNGRFSGNDLHPEANWWEKDGTSSLMTTAQLVSTSATLDSELDPYYGSFVSNVDYSISHSTTTAAL